MKSVVGFEDDLVWSSGNIPTTIPTLAVTYCTEGHWYSDEFDCFEFLGAAPKADFVVVSIADLRTAGIAI